MSAENFLRDLIMRMVQERVVLVLINQKKKASWFGLKFGKIMCSVPVFFTVVCCLFVYFTKH